MENPKPSRAGSSSFLSWVLLLLLAASFFLWPILLNAWWPPEWIVRRDQRKMVADRVQAAGGWTALQQACDALVETNRDSVFQWYRGHGTNVLPTAIAALRPSEVWFYSPIAMRGSVFETEFLVVHIKVFGLHRTGGSAIPFFGLDFVSGTNANQYTPRPSLGGASGNGYDRYRKVADRIYEIYGPN